MYTITYWEAFAHLKRWFMSRWWDILADDNAIMDYLNFAIQDVYNEDNATWRHKTERLVGVENGNYTKYTTIYPIHKIQECFRSYRTWQEINYADNDNLTPTLFAIKNTNEIKFEWNEILSHKDVKEIEVTYIMDYVPATTADKTKVIPLPYRYIPALMKLAFDWAAPINLMAGETATTDFFSHAATRIKKIADNDSLTDYIDVKSAY